MEAKYCSTPKIVNNNYKYFNYILIAGIAFAVTYYLFYYTSNKYISGKKNRNKYEQ